jgi:ATP-binding cassette subfamily E protein 1
MQRGAGGGAPSDKLIRIAIVDDAKCKPKKCAQECKKSCPVVRMGIYF